jgi:hypothetical protein
MGTGYITVIGARSAPAAIRTGGTSLFALEMV